MDIKIEDLECLSGEEQYYWVILIEAAREYRQLNILEQNRLA